jgi:aspartate/methionine/tyrosine aminotransferase
LANDSIAFADRILTDTGVAMTPGVDFDAVDGRSHMRLSFAGSTQDIKKAVQRLNDWLAGKGR